MARVNARPVKPERFGAVGADAYPSRAYACAHGVAHLGSSEPLADIPYVVEAWVDCGRLPQTGLIVCVNRTPVTGNITASRSKRDIDFFGCGLAHKVAEAPKDVQFGITLNITTPYMPITSDGKAPDLNFCLDEIASVVERAVKRARRPSAGGKKQTQKDVMLDNLDEAVQQVSGGRFRFGERQLLYRLRPLVMEVLGAELMEGNFKAILTDYESENGEIPLMYREPRGTLYHPHRSKTISLGTLMVETYDRPLWTYNKLLYIEKEGFSEALKELRWAEKNDCALTSSKGFTTRAVRDLVDKLAEHDEPVTIFCVHDADAYGTMIYQTFQEATKARGARKIKIINLGLEPWEALSMGLEVENVKEGERRKPVAEYARLGVDGDWEEWLQTHRVELNAMTTPQFVEWLDAKMEPYEKLIPPVDVLEDELEECLDAKVRAAITERILREADLEAQVAAAVAAIDLPDGEVLARDIEQLFEQEPEREWRDHIEEVADKHASLTAH